MSRILIVEDETVIRSALQRLLEKHDYQVNTAASLEEVTQSYCLTDFDLIITDQRLPGAPGTDLIAAAGDIPVLIMTSYASLRSAVEAMKLGAADYIAKPFDYDELLSIVSQTLKQPRDTGTASTVKEPQPHQSYSQIIGECEAMQKLFRRIDKVAKTNATVLILGESGTGKELAARAIHDHSTRAAHKMVSVNCASIPDTLIESELFGHEKGAFTGADSRRAGLIEAAEGSTLFLDEIGELPQEAQARLLRFLQEGEIRRVGAVEAKKVDVRLIAATHRDLKTLVKAGRFRADLYYRLYVMELQMPPLRARGDDILTLARYFLEKRSQELESGHLSFSADAERMMLGYSWPGNVRELQNAIERAVILADSPLITPELLGLDIDHVQLSDVDDALSSSTSPATPDSSNRHSRTDLSLDDYFRRFVLENQKNMSETELAKTLGISRKCLWERRQKLGIPRQRKHGTPA